MIQLEQAAGTAIRNFSGAIGQFLVICIKLLALFPGSLTRD